MELIPIAEAAEMVGTDVATLREQMREGKLMEYRQSGRLFANKEELLAVFAQKRLSSKQKADGPRIIAVANQKGGTGKTTTTSSLGYLLAQRGPTLLIDADPQGNMTQSFGLQPDSLESTLYEVLVNGRPIDQIIQQLSAPLENISIIGSNLDLAQTTLQVSGRPTWATLLRNALAPVRNRYKYILIDCPPNLDALTVNALVAATEMIVPVEMGAFSLRGTSRLLDVIRDLKVLNPSLQSPRFLACRVKAHTRLSAQIQLDLGAGFAEQVFKTYIREGTVVGQAQYAKMPLAVYGPSSGPAQDYVALIEELLGESAPIAMPVAETFTTLGDAATVVKKIRAAVAREAEALANPPEPMPKEMAATNGNGDSRVNGNGNGKNGNGNGKHSNGKTNGHAKEEAPAAIEPAPIMAEVKSEPEPVHAVVVEMAPAENGNGKKANGHDDANGKASNGHSNGATEHAASNGKASNGHSGGAKEHAASNGKTSNGHSGGAKEHAASNGKATNGNGHAENGHDKSANGNGKTSNGHEKASSGNGKSANGHMVARQDAEMTMNEKETAAPANGHAVAVVTEANEKAVEPITNVAKTNGTNGRAAEPTSAARMNGADSTKKDDIVPVVNGAAMEGTAVVKEITRGTARKFAKILR